MNPHKLKSVAKGFAIGSALIWLLTIFLMSSEEEQIKALKSKNPACFEPPFNLCNATISHCMAICSESTTLNSTQDLLLLLFFPLVGAFAWAGKVLTTNFDVLPTVAPSRDRELVLLTQPLLFQQQASSKNYGSGGLHEPTQTK